MDVSEFRFLSGMCAGTEPYQTPTALSTVFIKAASGLPISSISSLISGKKGFGDFLNTEYRSNHVPYLNTPAVMCVIIGSERTDLPDIAKENKWMQN